MTWAQENVMIHLLTETMSTSYTHLNICLSHFSSQQIGLGLEKGTYFVAQKFFFFWGGGGGGEIKDTLQWIPRVLLSGKILGLFSSAEFSQWILAVPTVHFLYQIMNNCRASDCFTKNNEKSLTYLCSG